MMSNGDVWVLLFGGVRSLRPTWLVYRRNGEFRARVSSDSETEILDVLGDSVLVRHWDTDDVERISIRRLVRAR
jgi:hypothetical protein